MLNSTGPSLSVGAGDWPLAVLCATGHNRLRSPVQPVFSLSHMAFMRSVLKLVHFNSYLVMKLCHFPGDHLVVTQILLPFLKVGMTFDSF